jgi:TRAP-type mannitol/chloroaromatic compound transport system substrate-binding protein
MHRLFTIGASAVCAGALIVAAGCGDRGSNNKAASTSSADAAPAKKLQLNMTSVYPTSLTLVGEAAPKLAQKIKRASGGSLEFKVYEPGALVPGLESIQAVAKGSVDVAWSSPGFFSGTDSAFNIFSTVPFGPGMPEYLAWMYYGGGLELQNELFAPHNIHTIPCGIQPPEASGWFRKEIKTVADLQGLKMRFFGLGGKIMEKFGVATQMLAPGDIFQSLQLGTIDATEFSNPSLDEKLGFYQVAKYYYFPGWHQQASIIDLFINKAKWAAMSDSQQAIVELACGDMIRQVMAEGEATQWKAMQSMREKGVQILRWPPEIMKAYEDAWKQVAAEEAAANPNFKRVFDSYSQFRANYALWREYGYLKQ